MEPARHIEIAEIERLKATGTERLAALLIDIDQFKAINDTFGHPAGDEVLRASAQRLRASTREVDAVGRIGGDEFLVLVADAQPDEVADMAERIRAAQAEPPRPVRPTLHRVHVQHRLRGRPRERAHRHTPRTGR
ncbi:MAG: GGDEF domain-containing protein [Mycobacterium sp.]|nr:GGDEF domain-containing protein [Mycobacterium sp.]